MKIMHLLGIIAILSAAVPSVATAGEQQPASNPMSSQPEHSTEKTVDTIKLYAIEKKDEALVTAKKALTNADAQIATLEQKFKEKKAGWNAKIAKKKEKEMAELRERRKELSLRYQKLKEASQKGWEAAKNAFIRSYHRLIHKLDKVNSDTLASSNEPRTDR